MTLKTIHSWDCKNSKVSVKEFLGQFFLDTEVWDGVKWQTLTFKKYNTERGAIAGAKKAMQRSGGEYKKTI